MRGQFSRLLFDFRVDFGIEMGNTEKSRESFFRITHVEGRFRNQPEEPHYGEWLTEEETAAARNRLDTMVPIVDRELKELLGIDERPIEYDALVSPVTPSRHFAIYAKDSGGFIPRALDEAEFGALVERYFPGANPFRSPTP